MTESGCITLFSHADYCEKGNQGATLKLFDGHGVGVFRTFSANLGEDSEDFDTQRGSSVTVKSE